MSFRYEIETYPRLIKSLEDLDQIVNAKLFDGRELLLRAKESEKNDLQLEKEYERWNKGTNTAIGELFSPVENNIVDDFISGILINERRYFSLKRPKYFESLETRLRELELFGKIIKECNAIVSPDSDFSEQKTAFVEIKQEAVIKKLYNLEGCGYIKLRPLLIWNGFSIINNEAEEIGVLLAKRGLITLNDSYAESEFAIISAKGKLQYEKEISKSQKIKQGQIPRYKSITSNQKVFIVHGHDESLKLDVARFIEKIGLNAIILHEQVNAGNTIIEKIEENTDVGFGIVLYTECDTCKDGKGNIKARARQNVVFEHGFLIAKLGRKRVCAVVKGEVETPSDISGILYLPYDSHEGWKMKVAKELREAGYAIDMNKI